MTSQKTNDLREALQPFFFAKDKIATWIDDIFQDCLWKIYHDFPF